MAVAPLRRGLPIDMPRERPPSPRDVARWITTAPPRRGLHTIKRLDRLLAHCPELNAAHDLVCDFAAMLDAQDAAPLPDWLERLTTSRLAPLVSLAKAIREDQPVLTCAAAVRGVAHSSQRSVDQPYCQRMPRADSSATRSEARLA